MMNESDEMLEVSQGFVMDCLIPPGITEYIDTDGMRDAAYVLADAYLKDPVFLWAMPKVNSRMADATAFFTFFLRRARRSGRRVFTNSDHSAVAVTTSITETDRSAADRSVCLPAMGRTTSPMDGYFTWIETHQPHVDHQYLEFIGCLSACRSKGRGSRLLRALLQMFTRQGSPVWSWSSNVRNLTFYHRLGFEVGEEIRRDADSPAVTTLWYPTGPSTAATESCKGEWL
jgi:ribosomal protein S18 acetylase RimI-like enzyme